MGTAGYRLPARPDRLRASLCRETMGDRRRAFSSSGLRLLLRLLSVVAALAVLCLSSRASAASTAVPMCGERNESVAAPPIFRAYQAGTLSASPCKPSSELQLGSPVPLGPERVVVHERPERVLGFAALRLAQSESSRLPVASEDAAQDCPGFVGSLFRPPRA